MERETHRHYFHPERGWSDDPDGAVLRLDAAFRPQHVKEALNRFFIADGRGGWRGVEERYDRPGIERGLVWASWVTAADGVRFLAFDGLRVLDRQLSDELLSGLSVRDDSGRIIEPTSAGMVFLLDRDDAKVFSERVRALGGEIQRGQPLPVVARQAAEQIEAAYQQLEALLQQDLATEREADNGDFSGLSAFEQRTQAARSLLDTITSATTAGQRAVAGMLEPGRTLTEQAEAAALLAQIQQASHDGALLWEARVAIERNLARRSRMTSSTPATLAARRLLLGELASLAHEAGYPSETTATGVRIRLDSGWLELDEQLQFQADTQ
jgi:hypothetical protein